MRGRLLGLTVDFLESELLGLADEAEDHEPGDEVQASVESDCWIVRMLAMNLVDNVWDGINLQAPTCVMASTMAGKVKLRIPAMEICQQVSKKWSYLRNTYQRCC